MHKTLVVGFKLLSYFDQFIFNSRLITAMDKRKQDVIQMCCEVSEKLKIKVAPKGGAKPGPGGGKCSHL